MNQSEITPFGINGFGRIGRTSLRVWWEHHRQNLSLKAINTSGSMEIEEWAHLLKYDTIYGRFSDSIRVKRYQSKADADDANPILGSITLGGTHPIIITAQRDPARIPWQQLGVLSVIESTGVFRTKEKASAHLKGGAQKVIISAPAKGGGVPTSVLGVTSSQPEVAIISNASCTTNCVAPVAQIMVKHFGVSSAVLTTIHSYTDDQNLQDNSHAKDLRRARAAAMNIIPTSTGAAKATTQVIPELQGLFDGMAVRVPTVVGSLSDLTFVIKNKATAEEINQAFEQEATSPQWQNILATTRDPIVSADIIGRKESSIIDLSLTTVVNHTLVKIISWYDNEYSYCHRLIEQV